jgi:hypothetical protein
MTRIDVLVLPAPNEQGLIAPRALPRAEDFRARAPEIADSIQEIADTLQAKLGDGAAEVPAGAWAMDSVTLGFELALEAEAGVVIAKTSATATFSIKIKWTRGQPDG